MSKTIREIKLSRGILIHNNKVLLVRDTTPGQGHFFLPGGNVEPGEPIAAALPREWKEELGWQVTSSSFLGCIEHRWSYRRKQDNQEVDVFEVNFLFSVETSVENLKPEVRSQEPHLEFKWVSVQELEGLNILPGPLKAIIPEVAKTKTRGVWASTL